MANIKHGLTKHPLYKRWKKLKAKCLYEYQDGYSLYGGKGVVMCEDWKKDFNKFFVWAMAHGWTEDKVIALIEGSMIVGPEGCEITTQKKRQQRKSNTKMVEWGGKEYCLRELCDMLGKNYYTVASRVNTLGWSVEDALMEETKEIGRNAPNYGSKGGD